MNAMMARWTPRVKQLLRSLVLWLAPAGSWRQRMRFQIVRLCRRWRLPKKLRHYPKLPDVADSDSLVRYLAHFGVAPSVLAEESSSDRVYHWLDFHPHVLSAFPLATTPVERPLFISWVLTNHARFGIRVADIVAFLRELTLDRTRGIELLYRRWTRWQRAVPNGLTPEGWDELRDWLADHYAFDVGEMWCCHAECPVGENVGPGVNLLAHFCYPSGLQVAAKNTRAALMQTGFDVSCRDVPNNAATDLPERRHWLGLHPHPITIVQLSPEPLGRNAYFMAGLAERPGVYHIGYWYWELEAVPPSWARQKNWLNELWAPTPFIADALRRAMPLPVYDMLPGMTMPPVIEVPRSRFGLPEDRFLFLFAFDMGSTRQRKNPEAVVAAFRRAFPSGEPVALVLKISRGWQDALGLAELQSGAEPGRVIIIDDVLSPDDIYGLMNCCDAYISLHRSEGFGLTLAEVMALGKPAIATGYSGNLAFMNEDNSLLVAFEMTTIRATAKSYVRGARWAEPSIDDAAEKMRWVVQYPDAARAMAERGRSMVREQLSLEAAGRRMSKRLNEILDGGKTSVTSARS
jgi:glycosyltransferase involved in cell wall biosynthesis